MFRILKLSFCHITLAVVIYRHCNLGNCDVKMPASLTLPQKVLSNNRTRGEINRREKNGITSRTTLMSVKIKGVESKQKME